MTEYDDNSVYFLLIYSLDEGRLVDDPAEFIDRDEAIKRYNETEMFYSGEPNQYEVVLIAADSIQTVKITHGHYFSSFDDSMFFADFFADA